MSQKGPNVSRSILLQLALIRYMQARMPLRHLAKYIRRQLNDLAKKRYRSSSGRSRHRHSVCESSPLNLYCPYKSNAPGMGGLNYSGDGGTKWGQRFLT